MKKDELMKKLAKVEDAIFLNDMIDHWSWFDREERRRLEAEKAAILKELEGLAD